MVAWMGTPPQPQPPPKSEVMHSAQRDKSISCCGGLCANLLVWGLRNAWTVVLSSIGISERSQGLFALARLAAPIYCHWRYCVTCCAWVGVLGGEIKRQGIIC